MKTVAVNGITYRVHSSIISNEDVFRPILNQMGYVDYVNALAPGKRNRFTDLFVKSDGTAELADTRKVAVMYRSAGYY